MQQVEERTRDVEPNGARKSAAREDDLRPQATTLVVSFERRGRAIGYNKTEDRTNAGYTPISGGPKCIVQHAHSEQGDTDANLELVVIKDGDHRRPSGEEHENMPASKQCSCQQGIEERCTWSSAGCDTVMANICNYCRRKNVKKTRTSRGLQRSPCG